MMTAPTRDPPTAPTGAIAPKSPMARFRFFPGGNVIPSKATMFGTIKPPPMPQSALMMQMETRLLENPPQRAQRTHHMQPTVNITLWPNTAPRRPPSFLVQHFNLGFLARNRDKGACRVLTDQDKGALCQRVRCNNPY